MNSIKILEDLKLIIFRDYNVWSGYTRKDFNRAIAEIKALKCCQNCKHYSLDGKIECKTCYAKDYTNWERKQ